VTESPPPAGEDQVEDRISALVRQIQQGDPSNRKFEKLYRLRRRKVFGFFWAQGFMATECDDLTQETFLRVYKYMGSYKHTAPFDCWLLAIMTNVSNDAFHHRARPFLEVSLDEADDTGESLFASPFASWLELALEQGNGNVLRLAIADLPPQERRCAMLLLDGLRYREIAALMGIPIGTVSAHLHHARKHLAKALLAASSKGTP
jgi:RNA polymerase sigma-70 factor, ECF subfamily